MTPPTPEALEIDRLRDELAEARRYTRTDPAHAATSILAIAIRLRNHSDDPGFYASPSDRRTLRRVTENLKVCCEWIRACPDGTEVYIEGVLWELALIRGVVPIPDVQLEPTGPS